MSDEIGKHAKLKPLCLNDLGVQVSPHPPKNFLKDLHLGCKMFYNFYRKEKKRKYGRVVESVDTRDLKSRACKKACEFKSRLAHQYGY
jgi:hypothetical protein